jgi:hypothetical protein
MFYMVQTRATQALNMRTRWGSDTYFWVYARCIIMKNAQMVCVLHGKVPLDEDFETYSSSCCDETTVWSELALLGRNDLTAG